MEENFYMSKIKTFSAFFIMLIFTSAFLVFTIHMLLSDGVSLIAIFLSLSLILFVWCTYMIGKQLFGIDPFISVSPSGITLNGPLKLGFVHWDDIEGFLPYQHKTIRFLAIVLKDEERFIEQLPKNSKMMAKINQKTGFPAFSFSLNYLKEKEQLIDILMKYEVAFFVPDDEDQGDEQ